MVPNSEAQLPETAGAGGFALLEKEEGFFCWLMTASSRPFMEERTQELIFGERLENVRVFSLQMQSTFSVACPACRRFLAFLPGSAVVCRPGAFLRQKGIAFCIGAFVSALPAFVRFPCCWVLSVCRRPCFRKTISL